MPAQDFTFSGESKRIIVSSGVTSVDVQDMYSRWKDWTMVSDNSKFSQAFRTFGGDPTIAGQFAPRYFFLTNGWRVEVNHDEVDFGVNLYTNELEPPVIVSAGAAASIRNSDAVNVDNGISETLDYSGKVIINTLVGVSGTTYPIGTSALPANNLTDAMTIANSRNINILDIFGTVNFNVDIHDFEILGGNVRDTIVFQNINASGCTFRGTVLTGAYSGIISGEKCQLQHGLSGCSGVFKDCGIGGHLYLYPNSYRSIIDSASLVSPSNYGILPSIHLNYNSNFSLRRYSGTMKFYDAITGSSCIVEFMAGKCEILSGCTGGNITARGIASFVDESSGTTIDVSGLLIPQNIASQHSLNVNTEIIKNK